MKKKLTLVVAFVLVFALGVAGTFAYLTAKTDAVVNTFTVGEVGDLSLTETTGSNAQGQGGAHKIIPGVPTSKDPKVSYAAEETDEAVYVFVKIEADAWSFDADSNTYTYLQNDKACLSWSVNTTDWTAVSGSTGVYYKALAAGTDLAATSVITNDQIAVNGTNVTEANINNVATGAGSLTFTAYAIQQAGFDGDVAAAWTALQDQLTPPTTTP